MAAATGGLTMPFLGVAPECLPGEARRWARWWREALSMDAPLLDFVRWATGRFAEPEAEVWVHLFRGRKR
jgi:hypothetical protein